MTEGEKEGEWGEERWYEAKTFRFLKNHFQWEYYVDKHPAIAYSKRLILDDLKSHIVFSTKLNEVNDIYPHNPHCPVKHTRYYVEFMLIHKLTSTGEKKFKINLNLLYRDGSLVTRFWLLAFDRFCSLCIVYLVILFLCGVSIALE